MCNTVLQTRCILKNIFKMGDDQDLDSRCWHTGEICSLFFLPETALKLPRPSGRPHAWQRAWVLRLSLQLPAPLCDATVVMSQCVHVPLVIAHYYYRSQGRRRLAREKLGAGIFVAPARSDPADPRIHSAC